MRQTRRTTEHSPLLAQSGANETDPANDPPRQNPPRYDAPSSPPRYEASDPDRVRKDDANREFQTAMAAKDTVTAEYHLKKSLDAYPTAAAYNNLGFIYLQSGDRDRARENFRAALRLDPNYEPALQNLEKLGATR